MAANLISRGKDTNTNSTHTSMYSENTTYFGTVGHKNLQGKDSLVAKYCNGTQESCIHFLALPDSLLKLLNVCAQVPTCKMG